MSKSDFNSWDFDNPSALFVFEDWLKNLLGERLLYSRYYRTFGLKGDEKVLDFGCGGGIGSRCLSKMLDKDGSVTCVELSSYWMRKAEQRLRTYTNTECIHGDIREIDLPAASYDVVTVFHVLHDIAPEIRQEIVNVLSKLLKPGGRFFINEPVKESHGMPAEEIRALLSGAGLQENEHSETGSAYTARYTKNG